MSYKHFTQDERNELSVLLRKGYSLRDIGKCLRKSHSSVSREIRVNSTKGVYDPHKAYHKARVRRRYSKYIGMKIISDSQLCDYVEDKIRSYWSPEQIAGRLKNMDKHIKYVSAPSIYKYLYSNYGQSLCQYLFSRRYRQKKRKGSKKLKKEIIPNRVSIEARPDIINQRIRFGDFEGDTLGRIKTDQEVLVGSTERMSRYVLLTKASRLKYAIDGFKEQLNPYRNIIESLTLDNGVENARYQTLDIPTFFCHPYSAWEKGTMENLLGRLRRFIPKKSSLKDYTQGDISYFMEIMNNTPRRCLNYKTPKEVFEEQCLLKNLTKISYLNSSPVVHLTI